MMLSSWINFSNNRLPETREARLEKPSLQSDRQSTLVLPEAVLRTSNSNSSNTYRPDPAPVVPPAQLSNNNSSNNSCARSSPMQPYSVLTRWESRRAVAEDNSAIERHPHRLHSPKTTHTPLPSMIWRLQMTIWSSMRSDHTIQIWTHQLARPIIIERSLQSLRRGDENMIIVTKHTKLDQQIDWQFSTKTSVATIRGN